MRKFLIGLLIGVVAGLPVVWAQGTQIERGSAYSYASDGTVSLPSYTFGDDTDTGMFSSANNQINFTAGGTQCLRISSGGVVVNAGLCGFGFEASANGGGDALMSRFGTDHITARNTTTPTTAQAFSVTNTFTSTTNFESAWIDWQTSANRLIIGTRTGSAGGSTRGLTVGAQGTSAADFYAGMFISGFSTAPFINFGLGTAAGTVGAGNSGVAGNHIQFTPGILTGSSVAQVGVAIVPTYNQTGTSSGTDLLINRTQTAIGSGTQLALDVQIAGVTKFNITNQGGLVLKRPTVTVDGATTFSVSTNGSFIRLACTGAETINTITGGDTGFLLYILTDDTDCTIADDDDATAANAIDLTGSANDVGAIAKVITLINMGTHWMQVSESDN